MLDPMETTLLAASHPSPAFGVDIGGSGIKAGVVDTRTGHLQGPRARVATPNPSLPDAVAAVVADLVAEAGWLGPVGVAFPGVITRGVVRTAANVDASWLGTNLEEAIADAIAAPVVAINDADAAGVAEAAFGAAQGQTGLVIVTTLGTGIGTALLHGGTLIPNSELGHLEVGGRDAETRASAAARARDQLGWQQWAKRLQRYYRALEDYLWPDLFVLGGGVSRKAARLLPLLDLRTPIQEAVLHNNAGIVGAAMRATTSLRS